MRTGALDMDGVTAMAAVVAAMLVGLCMGVKLNESAWKQTGKAEKPGRRRRLSASHLIALGVLLVDGSATYIVLYLCRLAIMLQFQGALPYLTTLIGALQAVTGVVLTAYYNKAKAENTKGGITYDTAMKAPDEGDL